MIIEYLLVVKTPSIMGVFIRAIESHSTLQTQLTGDVQRYNACLFCEIGYRSQ